MKKVMITLMVIFTTCTGIQAMNYEQARREALFLTDKMAYELNLTDEQYNAAYEINLDYLMGVTGRDNVFGTYWERRNLDFSYILLDWQYQAFCAAAYFYRPLYWDAGYWHFGIYAHYPRTHFYFARPAVYISYRGGHSWHRNGGHSYWIGRRQTFNHSGPHRGMRDTHRINANRNDSRNDRNHGGSHTSGNRYDNSRNNNNRYDNNRHATGNHNSSTRVTVNSGNSNTGTATGSRDGSRYGGVRNTTGTTGRISSSSGTTSNMTFDRNNRSSSVNRGNSTVNRSSNGSRSSSTVSRSSSSGTSRGNSGGGGGSFGGGRR